MAKQMILSFDVENQTLKRKDENKIVEKSKNYVHAIFFFTEEWDDTQKAAIIENGGMRFKVYLENNECDIPNRAVSYDGFTLTVVGEDSDSYITITSSDLFIAVRKNNIPEEVNPYIREITSETLDIEKENENCNIEIPDKTYFSDIEFLNDVLKFLDLKGNTIKELEFDYGKVNDIIITIDNTTYKLTLTAYDKDNNILFTREADFNIEGMLVKSAVYDSVNEEIVITFQNDDVVRIPLSALLTGLATQDWVNSNFYTKTENDTLLSAKQDTLSGSDSIDITSNVVSVNDSYVEEFFATSEEIDEMLSEVFN